jgi:hypothetical protein
MAEIRSDLFGVGVCGKGCGDLLIGGMPGCARIHSQSQSSGHHKGRQNDSDANPRTIPRQPKADQSHKLLRVSQSMEWGKSDTQTACRFGIPKQPASLLSEMGRKISLYLNI